ncbi:MAG: 30S ribosomal protein S2 [Acidobacteriota bacterium]
MSAVTIKELLEAGAHFGHQTRRWNPKMKPYIYGQRNGIYIIDLQKTLLCFQEALSFVSDLAGRGGCLLFVGTKRQAQEAVQEESQRCKMYFVTQRWLGGTLTNYQTIRKSIQRLRKLEATLADDDEAQRLTKKELIRLNRERERLNRSLLGIKDMGSLPDAVFVIDPQRERIAILEARKLNIPVVAVVDTNCDPDGIDFPIPGNDDAIRAIRLFSSRIADAVLEGVDLFQSHQAESEGIETEGSAAAGQTGGGSVTQSATGDSGSVVPRAGKQARGRVAIVSRPAERSADARGGPASQTGDKVAVK